MRLPRPPYELAILCAVACALVVSLVESAVASANPPAQPSRAATRASIAPGSSSQPGHARPLAQAAIRIPTGVVVTWIRGKAGRQIVRQTRRILINYGQQQAIDYYCKRWLFHMGSYRTWHYLAVRDYRVARAWRFCATYW